MILLNHPHHQHPPPSPYHHRHRFPAVLTGAAFSPSPFTLPLISFLSLALCYGDDAVFGTHAVHPNHRLSIVSPPSPTKVPPPACYRRAWLCRRFRREPRLLITTSFAHIVQTTTIPKFQPIPIIKQISSRNFINI